MVWVNILNTSQETIVLQFIINFTFFIIIFLGDPDDFSLRKIEQNVVIPKIVRERAKYEKCFEQNKGRLI